MAISKRTITWFLLCASACAEAHGGSGASEVLEAPGASGTGFGDPTLATNGVRGGGQHMQSVDVYSIPHDGWLVLGWDGRRAMDGPGDDLALFENAFEYGEDGTFIDAAIVEASTDGATWAAFAHDYAAEDETAYSARTEDWIGFGGVHPVYLHDEENPLDPFDEAAGGDRFDFAALEPSEEADRVRAEGARYVRIAPASSRTNPDTGVAYPQHVVSDGPDIDGLFARNLEDAP